MAELEDRFITLHDEKRAIDIMISNQSKNINDEILDQKILNLENEMKGVRTDVKALVKTNNPNAEINDKDYIFMSYVMDYLPHGIIGLLFAVMFSALCHLQHPN